MRQRNKFLSCFWWLLLAAVVVSAGLWYVAWPRDHGRDLRYAVFRGDREKVEGILKRHPEVVNEVAAVSPLRMLPATTKQTGVAMGFTDELALFVWNKVVMSPVETPREREEFEAMEQAKVPALHAAVMKGDVELARLLLEHGADVKQQGWAGFTVLFYAGPGQEDMVRLLMAHGASVTASNLHGGTPLHRVAHDPTGSIARLYLEAGADPNAQDRSGWTPLHLAAFSAWETNICLLLLHHGARLDITNGAGKTPLDLARDRKMTNAVELLSNWKRP